MNFFKKLLQVQTFCGYIPNTSGWTGTMGIRIGMRPYCEPRRLKCVWVSGQHSGATISYLSDDTSRHLSFTKQY